jgi:putative DNA primase/helicase
MNARELTLALGGRWHGSYNTTRCPAHNDRNPSLTIRDGHTAPLVSCKAGCARDDVIESLKAMGLWSKPNGERVPWQPPVAKAKPVVYWHTKDAPPETQRACDIWRDNCGLFGSGSPAGLYLMRRGILPPWPEMLAFGRLTHPETRERDVPALIVARQCPTVHLVRGIQRIFLTEDGQKYPRGTVKMSLGSIEGGRAELLWPDDELIICEGVESALSAWRLSGIPAWAMCGPFPAILPLPQRVRTVRLIADNDKSGASARKACELAKSLRETGRYCEVRMAPVPGADANDVLMQSAAR